MDTRLAMLVLATAGSGGPEVTRASSDGRLDLVFRVTDSEAAFSVLARSSGVRFALQPAWNGTSYLVIDTAAGPSFAPIELRAGAEHRMEAAFLGPHLSLKVWDAGELEPALPLVEAIDPRWGDPRRGDAIGFETSPGVALGEVAFAAEPVEGPERVDPASVPVSGIPVPRLSVLDDLARRYLAATNARSIVLAYRKDGEVQFHRAYGWADEARTIVQRPDAAIPLECVARSFLPAAVRELAAKGRLGTSDKGLDLEPTLADLIEIGSGCDLGSGRDVAWRDFAIARELRLPMPIAPADRIRDGLGTGYSRDADFRSRTVHDLLDLAVEQASGMRSEEYVRLEVLPKSRLSVVDLLDFASKRRLSGGDAGRALPAVLPDGFFDFHVQRRSGPGVDTEVIHWNASGEVIGAVLVDHSSFEPYYEEGDRFHPVAAFYLDHVLTGLADWPERLAGDMNGDGAADEDDVAPFLLAVQDVDAYAAAHPDGTAFNGDLNGDLRVDEGDVEPFLARVGRVAGR